ncbi:MAG: hypothetical protein VX229_01935, partial [Pseudomonadota bacterium]|nr:hypothetical protein [Pseudomonadota bacterium]
PTCQLDAARFAAGGVLRNGSGRSPRRAPRPGDSHRGSPSGSPLSRYQWFGMLWLLSAAPLLVAFAGPVSSYTQATGEQLANPQLLIETLLPDAGETP